VPTTTLLIDADIVAYRTAAASERPHNWGDGVWSLTCHEEDITQAFDQTVEYYAEQLEADRVILCFSDPKQNWRRSLFPAYKSNRRDQRRPMLLNWLRQTYIPDRYETYQRQTLEADDVMGVLATSKKLVSGNKIVVSEDKDMRTIPCQLVSPRHAADEGLTLADAVEKITEDEADYNHLTQSLTGDTVDGYPGCKGVGPVAAKRLLSESGEDRWQAIVTAYEKTGATAEDALIQAQIARICRASDFNFKTKKVIPWMPHSTTTI